MQDLRVEKLSCLAKVIRLVGTQTVELIEFTTLANFLTAMGSPARIGWEVGGMMDRHAYLKALFFLP